MFKNLFRWQIGRQLSGYDKMLLWQIPLPLVWIDGYLLRFRKGSKILPHTDKVNNYKHYRLNIVLKSAEQGGEFVCNDSYINTKRFKFFRSDIMEHQVLEVTQGSRYVLSLGFAIKKI
jgi:2OG-Fe(II) oxygenase superfamily